MSRRASLVALALLVAFSAAAGEALAHALPVQVSPPSGAVVQVPPREVVLKFSESLDSAFSKLEVLDANGTAVSQPSRVDADALTMRAALPQSLAYGPYTVSWRALSTVDGHSTRGVTSFLFPDPSKPLTARDLQTPAAQQEALVGPQDAVLRGAMFLGAFVPVGAAVLVLGVARRDAPSVWPSERRLGVVVLALGALGAAATAALALSQAAAAAQLGLVAALGRPEIVFASRYGTIAALRAPLLLGAALLAWGAAQRGASTETGRALWVASLVGGIAGLATLSATSHSAALRVGALAAGAIDLVHLTAGAAWVGGLLGLGWVVWRPENVPALPWPKVAARFSLVATVCVAVVVLTGLAASLTLLPSLAALFGSDYGQVLLVKLGLVAVLLAFGGYNRTVLVPAIAAADEARAAWARRRFRLSVRTEAVLGVGVLLAAGMLTALSPPLAAAPAEQPAGVLQLQQEQDGVNVTLLISPSPVRVGYATFDLFLTVAGKADTNATDGNLTFLPPDRTLGANEVAMSHPHPGHFAAEGSYFTLPGEWTLRARVARAGAFDVVVTFSVPVAPAA